MESRADPHTAWHPSVSAVCLGLGESNQERRLQFSGRAVRGASSLLFIRQQPLADPGLALSRQRPQRHSAALGSTLRRCRSSRTSLARGSAASPFVCPLFLPTPPVPGPRASSTPGLSPAVIASEGVPLLDSRRTAGTPRFPGYCGPGTPPPSAYLPAALSPSYLSAKGREPVVQWAEKLLSCYARVCAWALILVWLSPMSRSDLEKQPGRGRPGFPLPSSLPVILPALPLGVASVLGRSHPLPSCVSPLLFSALRSTPLCPIPEQSGFSPLVDHGVGRGWPGRSECSGWR